MGKGEARHLHQNDHEPKHRKKPFNAIAQSEHFLLKAEDVQIDNVGRDNLGTSRFPPSPRGGVRNTSPSRVSDVTGRSDKITKSMVISLLNASFGNHAAMIATAVDTANAVRVTLAHVQQRPFPLPAHVSNGENSRTEIQNVMVDSTAGR